jgi:hypothetical protein
VPIEPLLNLVEAAMRGQMHASSGTDTSRQR